jgi:hypothetical protein
MSGINLIVGCEVNAYVCEGKLPWPDCGWRNARDAFLRQ